MNYIIKNLIKLYNYIYITQLLFFNLQNVFENKVTFQTYACGFLSSKRLN